MSPSDTVNDTSSSALLVRTFATASDAAVVTAVVAVSVNGDTNAGLAIVTELTTSVVPTGNPGFKVTVSVTLPDAPAATVPRLQVTTPAASVPPPVALTNVVSTEIVSVITTLVASTVPVFS